VSRAFEILRNGGPRRLATSIQDWYRYNPPLWYHRLRVRSWLNKYRKTAVADPFKIIWVDPLDIQYCSRFTEKRYAGKILDGDWDQTESRFEDHYTVRGIRQHFVQDIPWEDTIYYQKACEKIEEHGDWYGCWSPEEFIETRCSYIDQLYERIQSEGYKSQKQIADSEQASHRHPTSGSHHELHEITTSIGRDGQILFDSGKHRLSIARILEIDRVPVQVMVRHKLWQQYRRDIYANQVAIEEGTPHPDLLDLTESS